MDNKKSKNFYKNKWYFDKKKSAKSNSKMLFILINLFFFYINDVFLLIFKIKFEKYWEK